MVIDMMTADQLKNSILQLAMQGKLVEQRPEEGTGEELFQLIQAEKRKLEKSEKIRKEKPLPRITEEEIPFEIPEKWKWVRWGELSQSIQYGYNAPAKEIGRIKMVRISDIQDGRVLWDSVPYCDIEEESINSYLLESNDILFARTGGTVGKSYLVKAVPEESIYAGYLIRTRYSKKLCPEYMKYFMDSQLYWNQLRGGTIATAQPNCNGKTLSKMILPLPPLAEQKRIVAKIEELMPFVKQYAAASTKLNTLNASFPEMMKKSILQEAVQGKLVPQDPNDEPASVLLKKIAEEKKRLIKEGKIKKQKPLPEITEEEIPFDIPESWEWARVGSVFNLQAGKNKTSSEIGEVQTDILQYPCYGGNGKRGYVKDYNRDGDYALIGRQGALCGNINFASGKFYATEHAVVVEHFCSIDVWWSGYFLRALNLNQYATATAQPGLSVANINTVLIPVPPIAEQKRIVSKIEEIMPIINEYKNSIE